jgi:hypothetical protein
MKKIGDSDSFVATVQELKDMYIIDEEDDMNNCISCALCLATSFNKDLWFVLKDAGSGSMDDYICADCIKKINDILGKEPEELYMLTYDESYGESMLGEYQPEEFRGTQEEVYSRYKEMQETLKENSRKYINIEFWRKKNE